MYSLFLVSLEFFVTQQSLHTTREKLPGMPQIQDAYRLTISVSTNQPTTMYNHHPTPNTTCMLSIVLHIQEQKCFTIEYTHYTQCITPNDTLKALL